MHSFIHSQKRKNFLKVATFFLIRGSTFFLQKRNEPSFANFFRFFRKIWNQIFFFGVKFIFLLSQSFNEETSGAAQWLSTRLLN